MALPLMLTAPVGASLTLATDMLKVPLPTLTAVSVAMTLTSTLPTCGSPGVPVKVRVAALKLSQAGKADPSARVAVNVSVLTTSAGPNALAGISAEKAAF